MDKKRYFGELESLRGIAALMVVLYHIEWLNPLTPHTFFRNGYLMVDFFFVLSGFVICYNYGKKIRTVKDTGRFMFLRFGRLYPLHLFYLIIFLGIEVAKYLGELKFHLVPSTSAAFSMNNTASFIANLLLVQSFCRFGDGTFNGPSWSISTEFYTYLTFAIVVLISPKRKSVLFFSGFLVLLAAFLLIIFGVNGIEILAGWSFVRCVLGFFTGVLAYHLYDCYHSTISRWGGTISAGLLAILVVFMSSIESAQLNGILILPIFFALIVATAAEPAGGGFQKC